MTFHWGERPSSRSTTSQDPTYIGRYVAAGTKDAAAVKIYALSVTPPTVATVEGTLFRNDIQINPASEGPLVWDVDVFYGRVNRQAGSFTLRWDVGVGTERRYVSRETVASYPGGMPDFKGAIGVSYDMGWRIEGADAPVRSSMLVVEFKHPEGYFTPTFAYQVEEIVGLWNNSLFFGRAAGEMMLWGFRGAQGTDSETTIEYQFLRKPNRVNETHGEITGINALGHDHLWFLYKPEVDTAWPVRQPVGAYVERLEEGADFPAVLGFGA